MIVGLIGSSNGKSPSPANKQDVIEAGERDFFGAKRQPLSAQTLGSP
jgi:hypothetical protein